MQKVREKMAMKMALIHMSSKRELWEKKCSVGACGRASKWKGSKLADDGVERL